MLAYSSTDCPRPGALLSPACSAILLMVGAKPRPAPPHPAPPHPAPPASLGAWQLSAVWTRPEGSLRNLPLFAPPAKLLAPCQLGRGLDRPPAGACPGTLGASRFHGGYPPEALM